MDGVSLPDLRIWATAFEDCSFVGAFLRGSALATGDEGGICRWVRVSFDRADLRDCRFLGGDVIGCTFRNTRLDEVDFLQTRLEDVVFAGRVRTVLFDERSIPERRPEPHTIRDVDFSESLLENTSFEGCFFEGVSWPGGVAVIPEYPIVAARALTYLEDDDSLPARFARVTLTQPEKVADVPDAAEWPPDATGIVNFADVIAYAGEPTAELLTDVIGRAREELGI